MRLTGYNDSHPAGVFTAFDVEVVRPVHYVDAANRAPVFPFSTWATAATNIQDAVNASTVPGGLVLVTNGIYQTDMAVGHVLPPHRVGLTNVVLRSVNGPEVTVIGMASLLNTPARHRCRRSVLAISRPIRGS